MKGGISIIADYDDLCGEAPVWDERARILYWCDIARKRVYRCAWPTRKHELLQEGFEVSGLVCHESGGFVVVNSTGVWFWHPGDNPLPIAGRQDQNCCGLNDCIADPEGRMYSGSCFYDPARADYPLGSLFRIDTDGSVHVVDEGIQLSNGLGFSPGDHTLYLADSAARVIHAYDYNRANGELRNRRVFARVPLEEGLPDGLTVDAEGFVWSARWFGGCLVRHDPDGKIERRVAIPAYQTSSLAFGGSDLTDVFITTASLSDALPLAPRGYSPRNGYVGGKVFHCNLGIAGKVEYRARIVGKSDSGCSAPLSGV